MQPIFLLSLPRSGSTLLQRLLAAHPHIHTTAEPWLMLPLAQAAGYDNGLSMDYHPELAAMGIEDFSRGIPGKMRGLRSRMTEGLGPWLTPNIRHPELMKAGSIGKLLARLHCPVDGPDADALKQAINNTMRRIYAAHRTKAGSTADRFLSKTPRYYLISDFLSRVFPESKIILLWRSPLDNLASFYSTWLDKGLPTLAYGIDLMHGPSLMARAVKSLGAQALVVHYDQLLAKPDTELHRLMVFLALPDGADLLRQFETVQIPGFMGDPKRGNSPGLRPPVQDGWKKVFNTPQRRQVAGQWVATLPNEVCQTFGVDRAGLLAALELPADTSPIADWDAWFDAADAVRLPRPPETPAQRRRRRMRSWLPRFLRPKQRQEF